MQPQPCRIAAIRGRDKNPKARVTATSWTWCSKDILDPVSGNVDSRAESLRAGAHGQSCAIGFDWMGRMAWYGSGSRKPRMLIGDVARHASELCKPISPVALRHECVKMSMTFSEHGREICGSRRGPSRTRGGALYVKSTHVAKGTE